MNQKNKNQNHQEAKKTARSLANPLMLSGFILYAVSMFLPAARTRVWEQTRDLKGFECAIWGAIAGFIGLLDFNLLGVVWLLMSNLVMLMAAVICLSGKLTPRFNGLLLGFGLLIFFAAGQPHWLSPGTQFYVGYYVWCLSFILVWGGRMLKPSSLAWRLRKE